MSLAFRIIALLLLVVLFLPSGTSEHGRVLVVVLDGASYRHIDRLVERGELPTLGALRSGGVTATLVTPSSHSPREYWRSVFGGGASAEAPGRIELWSQLAAAGRRVVLVNVPEELSGRGPGDPVIAGLPGARAAAGFVGDSTGRVANALAVSRGRVEWPYRAASQAVVAATDTLEVGQASEWLDVQQSQPDARSGKFRIYRLDEDAFYLTPVYRRVFDMPPAPVTSAAPESGLLASLYVADDASFTAASSRVLDYLLPHASDVSRDRAEAARRLATGAWQLMVYYETLLRTGYGVHAALLDVSEEGGAPTADDLSDQYRQIDAAIGRMLEAAGPGTLLVVLTREPTDRPNAGGEASGLMLVGLSGTPTSDSSDASSVAPTLLELTAVDVRPVMSARPLYSVTARHRTSSLPVTVNRGEESLARSFSGSAETLERLGGLATSVSIPSESEIDARSTP